MYLFPARLPIADSVMTGTAPFPMRRVLRAKGRVLSSLKQFSLAYLRCLNNHGKLIIFTSPHFMLDRPNVALVFPLREFFYPQKLVT
jgi:hypothetical protein